VRDKGIVVTFRQNFTLFGDPGSWAWFVNQEGLMA